MNTRENWLWDQAAKAAIEAFQIQSRDPYAAVYLYYKRGALMAAINPPDCDFELASGERISPANTREQNTPKFFEHRGVQVFKLAPKSFDYVLKGVCITQRSGARDPQELIDAILDRRQPVSDQVKAIFPELLSLDEVPETKNQKGTNAKS